MANEFLPETASDAGAAPALPSWPDMVGTARHSGVANDLAARSNNHFPVPASTPSPDAAPDASAGPSALRPARASVAAAAARIAANIEQVIEGKTEVIKLGITVLLAEGHLLIEDVPGVGKTKFAKALARSIDCSVRRIQFTPDLLPSDVTGVSIYSAESRDFEFKPGAVFANIVVGDEINRASPKTQSALLESMEERQVTVDTTTYRLESPFMVLATQNPIDMEGTYPLPEAQRDRFTARLSMGYPDRRAEMKMLSEHDSIDPLEDLKPVSDANEIRALITAARSVYVADAIKAYAVDLANATRASSEIRLGASPRAVLQLIRAAKAWAAIEDRDYVAPDDVQRLVEPVLAHRLILTPEAQLARRTPGQILAAIVASTPLPVPGAVAADPRSGHGSPTRAGSPAAGPTVAGPTASRAPGAPGSPRR